MKSGPTGSSIDATGGLVTGTSSDAAFVEFQRVQKSYDGEILVVKDLNLAMPRGEFLTMLGPSGSGKTSLVLDTLVREGQWRYLSETEVQSLQATTTQTTTLNTTTQTTTT